MHISQKTHHFTSEASGIVGVINASLLRMIADFSRALKTLCAANGTASLAASYTVSNGKGFKLAFNSVCVSAEHQRYNDNKSVYCLLV